MFKNIKFIVSIFIVIVVLQFIPNQTQAQVPGHAYGYDDAGNRLSRTTILFKSGGDTVESKATVGKHIISIFPNPTQGLLKETITNLRKDEQARILDSEPSSD